MASIARKILVLLDIDSPRLEAVATGARLAQAQAASLELYDCGLGQYLPPSWADDNGASAEYEALVLTRRLQDLERLARPLRACGLEVTLVAEARAPRSQAIAEHIAIAAPDVIVKDGAAASADQACWQVQTDGILKAHARCPVLLVGAARMAENVAPAMTLAAEERP